MAITVKLVNSEREKEICFFIRREVFIIEQKISKNIEKNDDKILASYFLAKYKKKYVGTARYQKTDLGLKLERFAVLKDYRGLGVGKALVGYILNVIGRDKKIYLNAQEQVVGFYKKLGFEKIGRRFFEAGVPHFKMILK